MALFWGLTWNTAVVDHQQLSPRNATDATAEASELQTLRQQLDTAIKAHTAADEARAFVLKVEQDLMQKLEGKTDELRKCQSSLEEKSDPEIDQFACLYAFGLPPVDSGARWLRFREHAKSAGLSTSWTAMPALKVTNY